MIENALKYSDGAIEVSTGVERASRKVYVQVRDHGPGIPEHELARMLGGVEVSKEARAAARKLLHSGWKLEVIAGNEKHVTRLRLHPPTPQDAAEE